MIEDYLKHIDGCKDILLYSLRSLAHNEYTVDYKVIRKDDSFERKSEILTVLELLNFIYNHKKI